VAIDEETHLIQRGLLCPPVVCGTWTAAPDPTQAEIALRDDYLDALAELLADPEVELVGANIGYDFGCAANERPALLPAIFAAYDAGRVFDIQIAEALIDLLHGRMFRDPSTGQKFYRYSQGMLEKRYLKIERSGKVKLDGKVGEQTGAERVGTEDDWRLRYALLDGVPLVEWPPAAVRYPKEDVGYCLAIRECQRATENENLSQMAEQARAAWALHLSAVWGVRTDPKLVGEVIAEVELAHAEAVARFAAVGFLTPEGKRNTATIKRAVAVAYGVDPASKCEKCGGSGRVPSTKTKNLVQCAFCDATGYNLATGSVPPTDGGGVSTSEDTLSESGDEQLEAFAETGANEKLWTTYRPILLQGVELPINPEINALLDTGRCSYRNPNLQNQPRKGKIRECYVPRSDR
jgi:hypothetical protein